MDELTGLPATLQMAILYFADPDRALDFLVKFRWPDGCPTCPWCESKENSFVSTRRIWKCKGCKKQFSIKAGTILEDSPISLDKWMPAIWMIVNDKNGISSYELGRALGVGQKTAWFMLHRIRRAMQDGSIETKFSGEVEADESFIGGKMANMHKHRQEKLRALGRSRGGVFGKAIITGLLDRNTKKARVKVTGNVRQFGLRTNIVENVERGSTIYSDALKSYRNLGADGFVHEFIDHTEKYVEGRIHTNGLENFWSLFKRALKGTYVSVEPFHLQAYADEQCFRYNERFGDDLDRFVLAVSQIAGKRIMFKELIGKVPSASQA